MDSVFPCLVIVVGEGVVAQDLRRVVAFVDGRVVGGLEGELHVLRKVVLEIEIPIPREVLGEGQVHVCAGGCRQVAHLHVAEGAVHIRVECPRLR